MAKQTIADVDVAGKNVLMRVDFNVPLDDQHVDSGHLPELVDRAGGGERLAHESDRQQVREFVGGAQEHGVQEVRRELG